MYDSLLTLTRRTKDTMRHAPSVNVLGPYLTLSALVSDNLCPPPRATLSTAEYPAKNHGEALQKYNMAIKGPNDVVQDVTFYRLGFFV